MEEREETMTRTSVKKMSWILALGALLPIAAAQAQYVRIAPPPPVVEHRPVVPGRGYIWVPGYHRWDGARYTWVGGRWALPPRPAAVWIGGHWAPSPRGWFWVPGHWRG
jgi:hypothetical protein